MTTKISLISKEEFLIAPKSYKWLSTINGTQYVEQHNELFNELKEDKTIFVKYIFLDGMIEYEASDISVVHMNHSSVYKLYQKMQKIKKIKELLK